MASDFMVFSPSPPYSGERVGERGLIYSRYRRPLSLALSPVYRGEGIRGRPAGPADDQLARDALVNSFSFRRGGPVAMRRGNFEQQLRRPAADFRRGVPYRRQGRRSVRRGKDVVKP